MPVVEHGSVIRGEDMSKFLSEAAESVGRTVVNTANFTGRSRRLDVGYYWLVSGIASGIVKLVAGQLGEWNTAILAGLGIDCLFAIPVFALSARRFHDHDRSGWWALIWPLLLSTTTYERIRVVFHAYDPQWPSLGYWNIPLIPLALIFLVMLVIPGTVGSNRYGRDPREIGTDILADA